VVVGLMKRVRFERLLKPRRILGWIESKSNDEEREKRKPVTERAAERLGQAIGGSAGR